MKYQLPYLVQNLVDHVSGSGRGAAAHQDHFALPGHLLQHFCHLVSLVRQNAVGDSRGSAFLHPGGYGIGVDIIDLARAKRVAGRYELAPCRGQPYLEAQNLDGLPAQGSQDAHLARGYPCAGKEHQFTKRDVASGFLHILSIVDRPANIDPVREGLSILDHDHGIRPVRHHGAGGDLGRFTLGDPDVRKPSHGNASNQAEGGRSVLSGFKRIRGLNRIAVHGGTMETRNIHLRDDLLRQDAAQRAFHGNDLFPWLWRMVEDDRFGFRQRDEAAKFLTHKAIWCPEKI